MIVVPPNVKPPDFSKKRGLTFEERFMTHLLVGDGCWDYPHCVDNKGYGRVFQSTKKVLAHIGMRGSIR